MKLEQILSLVKEAKCNDFILKEIVSYNTEIFVIDSKVDMSRVKTNTTFNLNVYVDSEVDGTKYRGFATTNIPVSANESEVKKYIDDCCLAASYIKEKYYDLPEKLVSVSSVVASDDHTSRIKLITDALMNVVCKDNERLNSFEVFVKDNEVHMVTSKGSDISYHNKSNQIEVILNVNDEAHEIEIYYDDQFTIKSISELTKDIEEQLQRGQDRMKSIPNTVQCTNVIISDRNVEKFTDYYLFKANTQAIYMGAVNTKIGDSIYKEDVLGDKVTIKAHRYLDGAVNNAPCDRSGRASKDGVIIEDGICRNYVGDFKFSYYLGVESLACVHTELCGGKYSEAELKKEPYLECIEFSDFHVDSFTGNIAGELRLGYYYDGNTITPVSGGSISGVLSKLDKEVYFSKETVRYSDDIVPKCVLIKNAVIANVE